MIAQLLEVLIGLTLTYLIFSTIASAVVEVIEMVLQRRGKFLEEGVRQIIAAVAKQSDEATMRTFYDSPFISSLFRDGYQPGDRKLPSYIPPERFADAILQLDRDKDPVFQKFADRMRQAIGPQAEADVNALKAQCMRYFNESMERVSGWYRRYARWWLIGIGLVIAIFGNVDTLKILRTLSQDDALRQQVVEEATRQSSRNAEMGFANSLDQERKKIDDQLKIIDTLGLPVGWSQPEVCSVMRWTCPPSNGHETEASFYSFLSHAPFWSKVLGILLTTFALTFGGPFWFDLMNQFVSLRTSVKPKPKEKEAEAEPASKKD